MALEFVGDAISLSGLTGSRLKCSVIGQYYNFWWNITSGGPKQGFRWPTAIVELDAATGLVYIAETKQTVLGSSGHALELKCGSPNTRNLSIVLVEKDSECYTRLKSVLSRKWPQVNIGLAESANRYNPFHVYLLNSDLENALNSIDRMRLGNALFFFDPLRGVEYGAIAKVARNRIKQFYKSGTEFIIFIFTSDWFLGRDDFVGLPRNNIEVNWSDDEKNSALEADTLFGDQEWRSEILTSDAIDVRELKFIEQYRKRLHKWFRYVLPMPFNPKNKQIFHLILCSNFEVGVRATQGFYCDLTGNPEYAPDNREAYIRFKQTHPDIFIGLSGNRRPLQWKLLWRTIIQHEEGICDRCCSDFKEIENNEELIQLSLDWLQNAGYLTYYPTDNEWDPSINQYRLNWPVLKGCLDIDPPQLLKPLSLRTQSLKEISE